MKPVPVNVYVLEQPAVEDPVDTDRAGRPTGNPQAVPLVDVETRRDLPGLARNDDPAQPGLGTPPPDRAVRERAREQEWTEGFDPLGLEARRQVDAGRQVRWRIVIVMGRDHRRDGERQPHHEGEEHGEAARGRCHDGTSFGCDVRARPP